jgi:glucoamylase
MVGRTNEAPGGPGLPPRWTSSAKAGVGTALTASSRVWFTISHGILNEVYFPRLDQACVRDLGLLVADGHGYFSEEKRDATHQIQTLDDGVPAFRLTNRGPDGRYTIQKDVVADPRHDVVLQRIHFTDHGAGLPPCRLYALLAPHLVNGGADNTAWLGDYKGDEMLFAEGDGTSLALACSRPWRARSAGFVGVSDGWQDLVRHGALTWAYERAAKGNVALTGELETEGDGELLLALGFGTTWSEAAFCARASLQNGFVAAGRGYVRNWLGWQGTLRPLDAEHEPGIHNAYRISTAVLRSHESPAFPGGLIASLSIPWGFDKGDNDLGGYHLVWPRDLVETAGGLLAAGALAEVRRSLAYLEAIQEGDGHWPQNAWLDGTPYWPGTQMDECALPILLVDLARREAALSEAEVGRFWPMVERAARFLVQNGPVTGQDRWEEDGGYSPFTLAAEVAALLAAADLADLRGHGDIAGLLRDTADCWNEEVEWWTYATGTSLAREVGVEGYYVRISPPDEPGAASPIDGFVPIKNRPPEFQMNQLAATIVSPDALALVRFGLRAADDPRILNTIKVIDTLLKVELPAGPSWRRYNGDGYGEHEDGGPFNGTGIGRPWPLLTGERAHYELAAGRPDAARRLLGTLEALVSQGGLIPEQVWDGPDMPERELFLGKPTGSAMPLVWAHAEHVKLRRSLIEERVFDQPPQPIQRYQVDKVRAAVKLWRHNNKCSEMPAGKRLRFEFPEPTMVHWSTDGWASSHDDTTAPPVLGLHVVDLPTADLAPGATVIFTLYFKATESWAGTDYTVTVA